MRLSKYIKEPVPHYERSGTWVPSYVSIFILPFVPWESTLPGRNVKKKEEIE